MVAVAVAVDSNTSAINTCSGVNIPTPLLRVREIAATRPVCTHSEHADCTGSPCDYPRTIDLVLYRLFPLFCLIRSWQRPVAHEDGQNKDKKGIGLSLKKIFSEIQELMSNADVEFITRL
ncbi:hypothetical protein J6590_038709 [Homalodisca vitripennis]|nr:hypothetical protein J6590_038709 [Homalodisca vitripennis]